MTWVRWVSLGLAVGCGVVVAGALWFSGADGRVIAGAAGAIAVIVLATNLFLEHLLGVEIQQLVERVARASASAPGSRFESRFGLATVASSLDAHTEKLRAEVKDQIARRRELEIETRIAQAENRHLEAILNSISDAVLVTDAFNEVARANAAAARMLGFEIEKALRRPVDDVLPQPMISKLIRDTREAGNSSLRRHIEQRLDSDAGPIYYDVTLSCMESDNEPPGSSPADKGGKGVGVVTILRDITREREIAEMKSDFVANVSHELRTPLASIKAYMEMLIDGEAEDEQTRQEFYGVIQGETNRLSRLIDNILNIGRIESGIIKVQRERFALPTAVHEAVEIVQPQAKAKNIGLVEVPSPLYFHVHADRDMILQVTVNLLANAIKYTPEGGEVGVSISVDTHDKMVNVAVSDNGVGIPEESLPHLFDKFYRVDSHKKIAKGTGLGLNLVKHVIETVHDGKVGVTSTVGKGSTFTFSLPIAENE